MALIYENLQVRKIRMSMSKTLPFSSGAWSKKGGDDKTYDGEKSESQKDSTVGLFLKDFENFS